MKRIGLFLFTAVTALSQPDNDRDGFLVPVEAFAAQGVLHDYEVELDQILVRGSDSVSSAMMVTLPAFAHESMVYIVVTREKAFVHSSNATNQIWGSRVMVEPGRKKQPVGVDHSERAIGKEVANQIGRVFSLATSQVHDPKTPNLGCDGVIYVFSSATENGGIKKGQAWSPNEGSICGKLVALGEHMAGYVHGKITAERLSAESQELLTLLQVKAN